MSDVEAITRIDRVTVSEDRAQIERRGSVLLPAGSTRVRVRGVAPVLADKTLRVSAGAASVVSVTVERRVRTLVDRDDREALQLLVTLKEHEKKLRDLDRAIERARSHATNAVGLALATLEDFAVDASHGRAIDGASATIVLLEDDVRRARAENVRLEAARRRAREALDDVRARLSASGGGREVRTADIVVSLVSEVAGPASLELSYLVPGACWRPQHTVTRGDKLRVSTEGCVWQNTGEDWTDVELRLSTERPSLGREPPRLSADVLTTQRRSDVVHVEARDEEIETTGLGATSAGAAGRAMPGIDDGGQVRVLTSRVRANVPSDGHPHRIETGSFETDANVERVCMPELARAVIVRSVQDNGSASPLLAGPVTLVGEGGVLGQTTIPFLSAGERFELGWGPDPELRVQRDETTAPLRESLLSAGFAGRTHHVKVRLSNLGTEAKSFEVVERIPVSEIAKVSIEFDAKATVPPARPDDDGFVRWQVNVPARGRTQVELVYVLRHARDVVGL